MASSKKPNIPRNSISSSLVDIPLPCKNKCLEKIKTDLSSLDLDKCLKIEVTEEKSLSEWQRYISTICWNYSRKMDNLVKFTVQVIDEKSIGVWRTK